MDHLNQRRLAFASRRGLCNQTLALIDFVCVDRASVEGAFHATKDLLDSFKYFKLLVSRYWKTIFPITHIEDAK